jgi:hypothetical protein
VRTTCSSPPPYRGQRAGSWRATGRIRTGCGPRSVRQLVQVRDPGGEDEAVPALRKRGGHVCDDLAGACLAGDQVGRSPSSRRARRGRHRPRNSTTWRAGAAPAWASARCAARQRRYPGGRLAGTGDGVPDRPGLHGDQVVELVAPVRRGGQPEPAARRDLRHDGAIQRGEMAAMTGLGSATAYRQLADLIVAGVTGGSQGLEVRFVQGVNLRVPRSEAVRAARG